MQFDPRAAKLLKAGDHLTVPGAPGLRLVRSTVGWAWVYRYKAPTDGRMRQIKLGEWPAMSVAAAGAEWERQRAARNTGRDLAAERRDARRVAAVPAGHAVETVAGLLDAFEAYAAPRRVLKGRRELRRVMHVLAASIRALTPAEITRAVAYDLIQQHAGTPVQAGSLRRELGAAWEWAHDAGRLPEAVPNWWRQVMRGKLASKGKIIGGQHQGSEVKRVLSVAEVGAVLRHLPHVSRQIADLLTLYLWTGCRGAEIVAIEGAEISQDAGGWWWTIPRAKLKMRRHPLTMDLRVPLVGRALSVVHARMDVHGAGHLFPPTRGKAAHVDQKIIGVAVWWYMPRCQLRPEQNRPRWPVVDWSPHDLRRTVRTQLAAMGCPLDVAEAVLGHLRPGVVGVYDRHSYDAERRDWLTRLADAWEAAASR